MESINHILKDMNMGNVIPISTVTFPEREYNKYVTLSYELGEYETALTITPEYYRFTDVGHKIRGVFVGYRSISKQENRQSKSFDCVLWMTDGKLLLNGCKCLVNDIKEAKLAMGTPIEIELIENKKKYQQFAVRIIQAKG